VNDPPVVENDDYTSLQGLSVEIQLFDNDKLGGGISDDGVCALDDRDDGDATDAWDVNSMVISDATLLQDLGDVQKWLLNNGDGFLVLNLVTGEGTVYPGGTDDPAGSDITSPLYDRNTQCFIGQVNFSYVRGDLGVNGGDGLMAANVAQVTVAFDADGNDCPVASDFSIDTDKNSYAPSPIRLLDNIAANDDSIDWSTYVVLEAVEHESGNGFTHDEGIVSYNSEAQYVGQDGFIYAVQDMQGQWTSATVTINILDRNTPPVALNDGNDSGDPGAASEADSAAPANTVNISPLGNDIDADVPNPGGWVIDVASIDLELPQPEWHGTAVILGDGTIDYTPDDGFVGIAEIKYRVSDLGYDPVETYASGLPPVYPVEISNEATIYIQVTDSSVAPLVAGGPGSADNERGVSQSGATVSSGNGGPGAGSGQGKKPEEGRSIRGGIAVPKSASLQQLLPLWQAESTTSVAPLAAACLTAAEDRNGLRTELNLITRSGIRTLLDPTSIAGELSGLWITSNAEMAVLRGDLDSAGQRELFGLNVRSGELFPLHAPLTRGEQVIEFAISPDGIWAAFLVEAKGQRTLSAVRL